MMTFRTGQGIDFHKLSPGLTLRIGGVIINSDLGAVAHSDGDVLLHAICDALLGAAGLSDIGYHFPDDDEQYRNIDSKELLKQCLDLLNNKGLKPVNIDSTVILEKPKLSSYIDKIKETLSSLTGLETDAIGVKATTSEGMGFTGRGEGIAAMASVLISNEMNE